MQSFARLELTGHDRGAQRPNDGYQDLVDKASRPRLSLIIFSESEDQMYNIIYNIAVIGQAAAGGGALT